MYVNDALSNALQNPWCCNSLNSISVKNGLNKVYSKCARLNGLHFRNLPHIPHRHDFSNFADCLPALGCELEGTFRGNNQYFIMFATIPFM